MSEKREKERERGVLPRLNACSAFMLYASEVREGSRALKSTRDSSS